MQEEKEVKIRPVWNAGGNRNPGHIQRSGIRMTSLFSKATLESRKHWRNVFKMLKEKDFQTRSKILPKISIKFEGRIKIISDTQISKLLIPLYLFLGSYWRMCTSKMKKKNPRKKMIQVM